MSSPDNIEPTPELNGHPVPDDRTDAHRRALALVVAIITSLILLPAIFLAAFVDWVWLAVGLATWLASLVVASSVLTWRLGPVRKSR